MHVNDHQKSGQANNLQLRFLMKPKILTFVVVRDENRQRSDQFQELVS